MNPTRACALLSLLAIGGCTSEDPNFGKAGGGGDGGGTDGGTTDGGSDGGSGGDAGGTDGGGGGTISGDFDEPGDIVEYSSSDGRSSVDLGDISGDSNTEHQFYLIAVNPADATPLTYQVRFDSTGYSGPAAPTSVASAPAPRPLSPLRQALRDAPSKGLAVSAPPPATFSDADIGVTRREFRVRNSMVDDSSYRTSSATLWAVGETVAIWVDAGVPIDWDYDCDGEIDLPADYDAYGFNNCDLKQIATVVDYNIVPNLRRIFGEESDENGDGLVSVLITPELNVISYTAEDEDEQGGLVGSYADPEVDLADWNATTNPGSNEQEILYVFAPDPYGFLNPEAMVTVEEYTSQELVARIAGSFFSLISYNQHVLEGGGSPEEEWVNQAYGALAADLTGFGAVYYADAWDYLDRSHIKSLKPTTETGVLSSESVGAQYLFARYLYDVYGEETFTSLVQVSSGATTGKKGVETTGTGLIESVIGVPFEELVVDWQIALLTSGVVLDDGEPLVDATKVHTYADATTITAPTSSPAEGDLYGANGYQQGVNLRGVNRYMSEGDTDRPTESLAQRVTMNGPDFQTAVTGVDTFGYVEGGYAAQVTRLTDITLDSAHVKIQGDGGDFVGAVVRWADVDPLSPDTVVEQIVSPTKVDNVELPVLPTDGTPVFGVGELTDPGYTLVVQSDGSSELVSVYDTDRWLLSTEDFDASTTVEVSIHLRRRYDGSNVPGPEDVWLAVLPTNLVPVPTVEGTQRGSCTEGVDFQYPSSLLDYLYYQLFLTPISGSDWTDSTGEDAFTCGEVLEGTSCGDDWDRDGILDADELIPDSFIGQVHAMQCTLTGNDDSLFEPMEPAFIFDTDTLDSDDDAYFDRANNVGGVSEEGIEDAIAVKRLQGGQQFIIVVGAEGNTGTYELMVKALD